jgi:two-component sensor histidine kinase
LNQNYVKIETNIEVESICTRKIVPIGLIINEIATNAIKHGFLENQEAILSINMYSETGQHILKISNNGRPFSEDVELDNPDTLGLRLITALVMQLEGTIELEREPHPVFTIRFPIEDE